VLVIAQMGRQLGFEYPIDQALFEFGEQALGSGEKANS
jgi:hypothetical protein